MWKVENGSWRKKDTYLGRHRDFIYLVVVVEVVVEIVVVVAVVVVIVITMTTVG